MKSGYHLRERSDVLSVQPPATQAQEWTALYEDSYRYLAALAVSTDQFLDDWDANDVRAALRIILEIVKILADREATT